MLALVDSSEQCSDRAGKWLCHVPLQAASCCSKDAKLDHVCKEVSSQALANNQLKDTALFTVWQLQVSTTLRYHKKDDAYAA